MAAHVEKNMKKKQSTNVLRDSLKQYIDILEDKKYDEILKEKDDKEILVNYDSDDDIEREPEKEQIKAKDSKKLKDTLD